MKKNAILTYHNEMSILDNVKYTIKQLGSKFATLEPVYGQQALIGLPTFRAPFKIRVSDLSEALAQGIYTLD